MKRRIRNPGGRTKSLDKKVRTASLVVLAIVAVAVLVVAVSYLASQVIIGNPMSP